MDKCFDKRVILSILTYLLVLLPKPSFAFSTNFNFKVESDVDSLIKIASAHHNWAAKHYLVHGMLDSVIVRAKLALEIREKLWKDKPNIDLGKSYHNLGTFLKFKGDYYEAKEYLKEAVSVFTKLEHDRVLRSLLELGKIYKQEGDYISAEDFFDLVIDIAKERGIDNKIRAAVVDLGSTYIDAHLDSTAIVHLEEHMSYFDVKSQEDRDIIGKFYNNLATAYLRNNNYEKAIVTYKKASLFNKSNFKTQAKISTNIAIAYRLEKKFQKCYDALQQGKEFAYKSQDLDVKSFSHKGMAKYYESQSEHELALEEYQKAILLMVPAFTPKNLYANPKPSDLEYIVIKTNLLSYFSDKVNLLITLGREEYKKEILELFSLGDIVIDDMRSDHFIDKTKMYWRSAAFPFYEEALNFCHEESVFNEAFYFFEKSKSVLLLEGYSFNEAISKTTSDNKKRYINLKAQISQSKKGKKINQVDEIVKSQRNFEIFVDSLSVSYPHLFKRYKDLSILSLQEFQRDFVKDSSIVFVHYFYGKKNVFALSIDNQGYSFKNLGDVQEIDSLINSLNRFFLHPASIDNDFEAYKMTSNQLYRKVFEPMIQKVHSEVVLLPDGAITSIPFESLISNYSSDNELKYVIQDRVIRYSFSGSILNNMEDSKQRGAFDVVTFVPFAEDENMKDANFSGVQKQDFDIAKKNGLSVKYFTGEDANKSNLISFEERMPILHFSSHGFDDIGGEPKILLANSSLSLSELYTSFLPSDMVFLSACRTNVGEKVYGEGIQSMSRGFTFAGANSVVSSLWNLVADPNSKIVQQFYENLSQGQTKHLALHNAKLSYLEDSNIPLFEKSPYYWAGLVYYGESDHILKPRKASQINCFLIFTVVALLSIFFFFAIAFIIKRNKIQSTPVT